VIDFARAKGLLQHDRANPARWKGHLQHLLAKRGELSRGHHAAMPYQDVPDFMARLRARQTVAARALEFLILTAVRTGEVLGSCWDEIDFEAKVWTIPAHRMKAGRQHCVPLSGRALAILEEVSGGAGLFIFPGRGGGGLSGNAFRRVGLSDFTVHRFRSAFRDWCGDQTNFPREIAEAALAHATGDATERAYRRGTALQKRRELMEAWAGFCEPRAANVVALTRGRPS
jgi:integrase